MGFLRRVLAIPKNPPIEPRETSPEWASSKPWDRLGRKGVARPPRDDQDDFGGASRPAHLDDIYHGALSASVAREWAGDLIVPLRRALASVGVTQAVLVAVGQMRRDPKGAGILAKSLRIVRRGGPSQLGPTLGAVLAARTWETGAVDTVEFGVDHAILHDVDYAIPLIPEAFASPRQPLPPVDRAEFVELAHSGIRNTPGYLWFALNSDPSLGRLALGVRSDRETYELLAECPPVSIDLLMRAAAAMNDDPRVHEFAIRPVAIGDPALGDTGIVVPIRRDPEAPRSPVTILGDAVPLASGFDLAPSEIEAIRGVVEAEGPVRASLAFVDSRVILGVGDPVIAGSPVGVATTVRRRFESRRPTLLFAGKPEADDRSRFELERRLKDALVARLADRAPEVEITTADDPLLCADGYAIELV
jgi:hypothetical protein